MGGGEGDGGGGMGGGEGSEGSDGGGGMGGGEGSRSCGGGGGDAAVSHRYEFGKLGSTGLGTETHMSGGGQRAN